MLIHQMIAAIGDEAAAQRDEGPDRRVSATRNWPKPPGKRIAGVAGIMRRGTSK
jgi:hypothetical protein